MPEIRLVKRYPHIKDEDVTSIFQEGYIKGFENGRKGAIPIEWIKEYASMKSFNDEMDCYWHFWEDDVLKMVADWEKENEK